MLLQQLRSFQMFSSPQLKIQEPQQIFILLPLFLSTNLPSQWQTTLQTWWKSCFQRVKLRRNSDNKESKWLCYQSIGSCSRQSNNKAFWVNTFSIMIDESNDRRGKMCCPFSSCVWTFRDESKLLFSCPFATLKQERTYSRVYVKCSLSCSPKETFHGQIL